MSGPDEAGSGLVGNLPRRAGQRQGLASAALGQGDFRAMGENHGLVAPRLERARLLQRSGLEFSRLGIATGRRQAESERLRGEHLRVTVADPDRDFEPFAHVVEALVDRAGIDLAMPHHHAVGALQFAEGRGRRRERRNRRNGATPSPCGNPYIARRRDR